MENQKNNKSKDLQSENETNSKTEAKSSDKLEANNQNNNQRSATNNKQNVSGDNQRGSMNKPPHGQFNNHPNGNFNHPRGRQGQAHAQHNDQQYGNYNQAHVQYNNQQYGNYNQPHGQYNNQQYGNYNQAHAQYNNQQYGNYNQPHGQYNNQQYGNYNQPHGQYNNQQHGNYNQAHAQYNNQQINDQYNNYLSNIKKKLSNLTKKEKITGSVILATLVAIVAAFMYFSNNVGASSPSEAVEGYINAVKKEDYVKAQNYIYYPSKDERKLTNNEIKKVIKEDGENKKILSTLTKKYKDSKIVSVKADGEKQADVRVTVDGNDYLSLRPEITITVKKIDGKWYIADRRV